MEICYFPKYYHASIKIQSIDNYNIYYFKNISKVLF